MSSAQMATPGFYSLNNKNEYKDLFLIGSVTVAFPILLNSDAYLVQDRLR